MEVIIIAIVIIYTIFFTVVIRNYIDKCDSLEFRVETLEEEVEILENYIERNEEKWKD